jgi:hypothetical protein
MSRIVDQIALRASTLMRATETTRSAVERRLILPGSPAINATRSSPSTRGGNQRGARRRSSGKRMVSTMAVTTAPAIGQRDSAYADPCDSGSLGSDAWCLDTSGAAGRRFVGSDRDLNREEVRALRGDEIGVVRIRHDPVPFELSTAEVGLIGPSALPTTLPPTCRAWIPRRE